MEVRGRSQEDPTHEGRWPRGVTPRPRSGQWKTAPGWDNAGRAKRSYSVSEVRAAAGRSHPTPEDRGRGRGRRSNPMPEARGSGQEEQPHVQGAVATWAQEG